MNYPIHHMVWGCRLPRKEYKTITVRLKTYLRFLKHVKDAQKKDSTVSISSFIESLLDNGYVRHDMKY